MTTQSIPLPPEFAVGLRRPLRRASHLLPLEQRFMFDGAVADAAHAAHGLIHAQAQDGAAAPAAVTVRAAEPAKDEGKKEVVLVDTTLANYHSLEAGVRDGIGIVEFDGRGDGLAQIAAWAATQSGLDAIHILSHGAPGMLELGGTPLSTASMAYLPVQRELAAVGRALGADGDLLLYGCQVGAGAGTLLAGLAQATGADVAASTDATGAARLGANWTLESHTGDIDVRALALLQYDGVLGVITVADADLPGGGFYSTPVDRSIDGHTVSLSGPNLALDADNLLYAADAGLTGHIDLTITVAAGAVFALNALQMDIPYVPAHFVVTHYNGSTDSFDVGLTAGLQTVSTFGASMSNLTKVVISATDYVGMQNFNINTALPDTTPPSTTFSNVGLSADTGISNTDRITNTAAQTVSATLSAALDAGDRLDASVNGGASWIDVTGQVSGTTLTWNAVTLSGGNNDLSFRVTDAAGNVGPTTSAGYTLDTSAPASTVVSAHFSNDSGASSTDLVTNAAAQTISGALSANLQADETVYVSIDNGATWAAASGAAGSSSWTLAGVTLSTSSTLRVTLGDAAGNAGAAFSQAYTFDTSAPAAPGAPTLDTDSGSSASDRLTNVNTPTLSGSAEAGSTVTLYDVSTPLGTTVATGGAWRYTSAALGDGGHFISATATDVAGNTSAFSPVLGVTIDTSAPSIGSVAAPADGTYGAGQALTFTVNFSEAVSVDITGGSPRLALVVGASTVYADYLSGSGSSALVFSYTVAGGDSDSDGVTLGALSAHGASLADRAGNLATLTLNGVAGTAGVLVDGTQSAVASITNVSSSSADGAYGAGSTLNITLDFSAAVTVDTTNGAPTLALGGGGNAVYTGGSGSSTLSFSYTVAAGQNSADLDLSSSNALALNGATIVEAGGAHRSALLTLAAPGTAGSLGANQDLVIDTTAPGNSATGAAFSADSGSSSTDLITNRAAQTISGTLAANLAAGEQVEVSLDNGATWRQASASTGASTWSLAGQTLTGSDTLQVRLSDAAGNHGATYRYAYVFDTVAPAITFSNLALSADSGVPGDRITNTAAQTISATLSAGPGAGDTVSGSLDNGATWTDLSAMVSGTTLTWTGVTLAASDTLQLRLTDAAGNHGAVTSGAYVLDATAPSTSVDSVAFSADSGASSSDFITNSAAQTVSGTLSANLAAGDTVLVSLDNGVTWRAASAAVGSAAWSLAGATLSASDTLQVKLADLAGNDGPVFSQAYVYDTAATVPAVDALATFSTTPVLTGRATLAAGETMTVSVGGATYDVTPVAGAWTLDLATAVPSSGALSLTLNHAYAIVASVTDLAGNRSADTSAAELTLGVLAPPTTGVASAALSADSGASNHDFITNVASQSLSGTLTAPLAAGESLQVSLDNGASWRSASASATGWSLTGLTLAGSSTLLVKVVNRGGDGPLFAQALVFDGTAPAAPGIDALTTNTLAPTLTGSASLDAGDTLRVSVGGASYLVAVANGRWSLDLASAIPASGALALAAGGAYDVGAVASDLAGNHSAIRAGGALRITAAALPTLPTVTGAVLSADSGSSASDFITNIAAQTVSGTLSAPLAAGQSVEISIDGGATWKAASAAAGSAAWSASVTLSGSNLLLARVAGGGVFQRAYVLDTTAPSASVATATLDQDGAVRGTLSAPLAPGDWVQATADGGQTWQTATLGASGLTWTLGAPVGASLQVAVRDSAGNASAVLTVRPGVPTVPPSAPLPVATMPPAAQQDSTATALADLARPGSLAAADGNPIAPAWRGDGRGPLDPISALAGSDGLALTAGSATLAADGALRAPRAYAPIGDVSVASGARIVLQLRADAFLQASGADGNRLQLHASSADGTSLPDWLTFTARTARFEGNPPPGFEGTLTILVTARDSQGREAVQRFKIVIGKEGRSGMPAPAGRAGLSQQLQTARASDGARLAALAK